MDDYLVGVRVILDWPVDKAIVVKVASSKGVCSDVGMSASAAKPFGV